jgi:hypothetical protein
MSHDPDHDLMRRLVDYHDHIAAPPVLVGDDLRRGRRRVRRTRGLVAGGTALGIALVAAVTFSLGGREDDVPQPAGPTGLTTPMVKPASLAEVTEFGFHVEPGPGFEVSEDWLLGADRQALTVWLADGDYDRTNNPDVSVAVYYQGEAPELPTPGAPVTVHGGAGTYVEETQDDYWRAWLSWEYAPGSWVQVIGRGFGAAPPPEFQSQVVGVAEALRSGGGDPVRVPVRVGTLPEALPPLETWHRLSVSFYDGDWSWWLEIDEISIWATSDVEGPCRGSDGGRQTAAEFTYRGIPGCLVDGERIGLRLGDADVFVDFGQVPDLPIEDMKQVLAELTIAPDDPATWFELGAAMSAT